MFTGGIIGAVVCLAIIIVTYKIHEGIDKVYQRGIEEGWKRHVKEVSDRIKAYKEAGEAVTINYHVSEKGATYFIKRK